MVVVKGCVLLIWSRSSMEVITPGELVDELL